jgi:hypothetical protein
LTRSKSGQNWILTGFFDQFSVKNDHFWSIEWRIFTFYFSLRWGWFCLVRCWSCL